MAGAEDIVFEISGNAHMNCYQDLRLAVEIAHAHLPTQLSMKELTAAIVPKLESKKKASSIARALARATEDAWDHHGRDILENKYGFRHRPTPKELILKLARAIQTPVEYRLLKDASGKYSIIASNPNENCWMVVSPLLKEDHAVSIIHTLSEAGMSMECFRDWLFQDGLTKMLDGDFHV